MRECTLAPGSIERAPERAYCKRMPEPSPRFFPRLWMALVCFFRIVFRPSFAAAVLPLYRERQALPRAVPGPDGADGRSPAPAPVPAPALALAPEKIHASGLFLLSMLQREGRFIDFLQEDVAGHPDADVGAAARVVHAGCRRVVREYLSLQPVLSEPEGAPVTISGGFDASRIRLTGNVAGQPPFHGSLRHHGWVAQEVRLPSPPVAMDLKVIAPAEVEL